MITNESFRRAERFLMAAELPAEVFVTLIALAIDTMPSISRSEEAVEPEPIEFSLSCFAARLGIDRKTAARRLRWANAICSERLGSELAVISAGGGDETPSDPEDQDLEGWRITLTTAFGATVQGIGFEPPTADECLSLDPDTISANDMDVLIQVEQAAFLYRCPDTAGERWERIEQAAALLRRRAPNRQILLQTRTSCGHRPPIGLVLVAAVLHGGDVPILFISDELLTHVDEAETEPDYNDDPKIVSSRPAWRSFSSQGELVLGLLPHVPLTILAPVPRDVTLAPRQAASFAGAVGPFRIDRGAAAKALQAIADRPLSPKAADRLVQLWHSHTMRAKPLLAAAQQIAARMESMVASHKDEPDTFEDKTSSSHGYSELVERLASGLAPHVWAPVTLEPKPRLQTFYKELFVTEPDASLLFSDALKNEAGVRILLLGPPGTGKSAAAAHIAADVLKMASFDVKASDVFFTKLGAMERAISRVFRQARENNAVLIFDEADSIAQSRYTASDGAAHIVVAATNQLLLEMDRHDLPIILCSNFGEKLDPAVKRRADLVFEVKPLPAHLERRAMQLILGLDLPDDFAGFGDDTTISDYANAKRSLRLLGGGTAAAISAVGRARDIRLGQRANVKRKIGF